MGRINNVITIPASLSGSFFKYWLEFLRPFHKLTDREMDILAAFIQQRHELSKLVTDNNLLDSLVLSEETKKKVREQCGITASHLQVVLSKLKKNNIIINNRINPKFIPRIGTEDNNCQLLLSFIIDGGNISESSG